MAARPDRHEPVLITNAELSPAQEQAIRKRRYALLMGLRIPILIAAAALSSIPWLAVTLVVASIPLPWIAVLLANDRLLRPPQNAHRYHRSRGELEQHPPRSEAGPARAPDAADPSTPPR
ncbi:MAG: DUF3099 domain-containing protein [Pseudonocardia sp.]|nr:DUF3099 domain-containing protein [Pseudonocardia sp.]